MRALDKPQGSFLNVVVKRKNSVGDSEASMGGTDSTFHAIGGPSASFHTFPKGTTSDTCSEDLH